MTATTIHLSRETTFTRTHEGKVQTRVLPKGKTVAYRVEKTVGEVIHIASYTDSDGMVWVNEVRKPRVAPVPAVQAAVQTTAVAVHAAVSSIVDCQARVTDGDADESRVRQLARTAESLRGDVYQVNYYIPSSLGDRVGNPSRIFRRHGFRLDGSNWVFPAHGLEHRDIQRVLRGWDALAPVEESSSLPGFGNRTQVRYWTIKYTREQLSQMRELAQGQLAEELQKTHRSLIERIDSAAKDLEAAQDAVTDNGIPITQKDRDKAESSYNARTRATITEACERFEMCLKGAEIFDDTGSLDALFGAVRDAIRTQALVVNAMLRVKKVKTVVIPASIGV